MTRDLRERGVEKMSVESEVDSGASSGGSESEDESEEKDVIVKIDLLFNNK